MKKLILMISLTFGLNDGAVALTANRVWVELTGQGRFRVWVNYTVPELQQFREAYADFAKKAEAEKFYFDLLRGAEFQLPLASDRTFSPKTQPTEW